MSLLKKIWDSEFFPVVGYLRECEESIKLIRQGNYNGLRGDEGDELFDIQSRINSLIAIYNIGVGLGVVGALYYFS